MTAAALAEELEVSVRTIYRDMEALSMAGVPVYAEPGPGGGCRLMSGYRSPFGGLSDEEAAAFLTLGVPDALRELGLGDVLASARKRIGAVTRERSGERSGERTVGNQIRPLRLHLDMPRWFASPEPV